MMACIGVCMALATPVFCQETSTPTVPKWEFGLQGGAGLTTTHLFNHFAGRRDVFVVGGNNISSYSSSRPNSSTELFIGGFATRRLNERWALRGELSWRKAANGNAISLGAFTRYRALPWLQLEAGLEARQAISGDAHNDSKIWLGAAFGKKNVEFNVRFAPGFMPKNAFQNGGFIGTAQVGVSVKLAAIGGLFGGHRK